MEWGHAVRNRYDTGDRGTCDLGRPGSQRRLYARKHGHCNPHGRGEQQREDPVPRFFDAPEHGHLQRGDERGTVFFQDVNDTNTFDNDGTFNQLGSGTTTVSIGFDNSDTVDVQAGKAAFTRGYTQTAGTTRVASGAELEATSALDIQGGRVEGEGLIDADVDLAGTLAPGLSAGQLFFEGDLNFTNTAIYEWELDGGGFSDSVDVTGNLLFGSTATLALVDLGGTPNPLTEYTLFTYSGTDPTNPTWSFDTSGAPGWDVSSLVVSVDTVGDRVFMVGLDVGNGLDGDFDNSGAVDGFDFLQWQRGESPNPLSQSDLAAWEANYGAVAPLAAASTSVPEPATGIVLLLGMMAMFFRRELFCERKGTQLINSIELRPLF
ncbi:MAG: PEP-CTERM sorting domain-containing protein [Planctomycetes bacterium]|nr:PEP-CTERM sorting domain-containing protein [Planctomycetota bacterium]